MLKLSEKEKNKKKNKRRRRALANAALHLLLQLIGKWRNISVGDTAEGCLKDKPKL